MSTYLSVIIPAYNEEKRIAHTLEKTVRYLENTHPHSYEIVVVDDGSHDATKEKVFEIAARRHRIRLLELRTNQGKGAAVAKGMLAACGSIRLFMDADNSTSIQESEKLMPFLKQDFAVIIGSRALPESTITHRQPFIRESLGRLGNRFIQLLLIEGFQDTQCGFKMYTAAAAEAIFSQLHTARWAFDIESLMRAQAFDLHIKEVPVIWHDAGEGSKMASLSSYLSMARELLQLIPLRKHL